MTGANNPVSNGKAPPRNWTDAHLRALRCAVREGAGLLTNRTRRKPRLFRVGHRVTTLRRGVFGALRWNALGTTRPVAQRRNYMMSEANRTSSSPTTEINVSITDQVLMVSPTVMPKYSLTSQKPASLTCEKNSEPAPTANTTSARCVGDKPRCQRRDDAGRRDGGNRG
jgi:hypothetical protein